ncbi:MAG: DNA alkylation repair protein, partial [Microgenomates group bacterium]
MAKYGIKTGKAWGISIPNLRKLAKEIGKDHELAQKLWKSGIHEARILASMIDEVEKVTEKQMDNWLSDFNSWDVCDQVCMNLFDKTPYAFEKAKEWSMRKEEFEKRGGFALMACLAWHDKESPNSKFIKFFPYIKRESTDERNYVKKAVNWALRQIGKKNLSLNKAAIKTAEEVQKIDSRAARWIAADALRELTSEAVQRRLVK